MHNFDINGSTISQVIKDAEKFIRDSPFGNVVINVTVYPDTNDFSENDTGLICAYLIWEFEREIKLVLGEGFYANRSAVDMHHYTFTFYEFSPQHFLSKEF